MSCTIGKSKPHARCQATVGRGTCVQFGRRYAMSSDLATKGLYREGTSSAFFEFTGFLELNACLRTYEEWASFATLAIVVKIPRRCLAGCETHILGDTAPPFRGARDRRIRLRELLRTYLANVRCVGPLASPTP